MAEAYTAIRSWEEFSAAREQFNVIVSRLRSEAISRMEHGITRLTIKVQAAVPSRRQKRR